MFSIVYSDLASFHFQKEGHQRRLPSAQELRTRLNLNQCVALRGSSLALCNSEALLQTGGSINTNRIRQWGTARHLRECSSKGSHYTASKSKAAIYKSVLRLNKTGLLNPALEALLPHRVWFKPCNLIRIHSYKSKKGSSGFL